MSRNGELYLQREVVRANWGVRDFVVFDIGANRGDWSASLLQNMSSAPSDWTGARCFAFEPISATRVRLTIRLQADEGRRIEIVPGAVSDRPGRMRMAVMSPTGGTNSLVFDKEMESAALGFEDVELVTIDQFCKDRQINHIHLIKCDTEGNDLNVLRGALALLKNGSIDVFQFEYNYRWINAAAFLKDVFSLVEGTPYVIARVMTDYIEVFDRWHPELDRFFQSNYALVHSAKVKLFRARQGTFDKSNTYA
ncbi:FkbM family methyltransferase [Mesorhizobium sp. M0923]|uniref:FkbM family methyltransferase n=1 Tax=Mesorhizobium sp. M0923 TaxID=2957028 RepID=UPI0033382725